ncbi:aminotransferase class IV [Streptomyces bohaiensis]|uniref:Aminotransferase n=1 Tax=Streptomyces bohaiensis TaxID=1431344 RepID=A0ABX1CKC7_9ACTN|nr:aminotransferase class IV [Streptomyces bohaiensis]NJQ17044.1 aminotransferase [Streptomyces bohaiensis]
MAHPSHPVAELDGRPMTDEALLATALTGYGHFTTMRVTGAHRVRGLDLHLARLVRDCGVLFGTEPDTAAVVRSVRRAVERNRAAVTPGDDVVVRVSLIAPEFDVVRPPAAAVPRVLVTVREAPAARLAPLRVRTARYVREMPTVKHSSLLGALHTRRAAQLDGWDDVLFIDREGRVTEGATWNVGFVRDGDVVWPRGDALAGVTAALLRRTEPGSSAQVAATELAAMDAAFATNAGFGVRPLAAVDGTRFDPGHPVLDRLHRAYLAVPAQPL